MNPPLLLETMNKLLEDNSIPRSYLTQYMSDATLWTLKLNSLHNLELKCQTCRYFSNYYKRFNIDTNMTAERVAV
jgi:hypothetical protein